MDSQLKIIFSFQIAAAFIFLLLIIHFALGFTLFTSALIAALVSGIIAGWGYVRFSRHVMKNRQKPPD
jgi:hypothetical protein